MGKITISALMVEQPIGQFFYGLIKAKELCEISYSDVRRMENEDRDVENYLGIQRPLSSRRVKDISNYINTIDSTFPNSIIIAIDQVNVFWNDGVLEIEFDDENKDKIAKILDGQHRLAGFNQDNFHFEDFEGNVKDFELLVTIFVNTDMPTQAKIFSMVNQNQTKVNRSLVYDLESLAKSRSPWKTCHTIAVYLNKHNRSAFFKRIKRLGVKTRFGDVEPLTQAAFVENLVKLISPNPQEDRNTLLAKDKGFLNFSGAELKQLDSDSLNIFPLRNAFSINQDEIILKVVNRYFTAIANTWPESWDKNNKNSTLNKTVGLIAMMRLLKYLLKEMLERNLADYTFETPISDYEDILRCTDIDNNYFSQLEAVSKTSSRIYNDLKEAIVFV